MTWRNLVCATMLCGAAVTGFAAECDSPRQYYSTWQKTPGSDYAYRIYYYKPTPDYAGYKHHYVIHKGEFCYFFNPYEKQYWGRCPSQSYGRPQYSRLPPQWCQPTLAEIPEAAFPPLGGLPPLPESDGSVLLDLPPDDLPVEAVLGR